MGKVETVIPKELADPIIDAIVDEINAGNCGDGKIFAYDVQDAIRIRTGKRGNEALLQRVLPDDTEYGTSAFITNSIQNLF